LIVFFLLFLLYSYQDAFAVALMINGQFWSLRSSLAFISYLLFICGVIFTVSQLAIVPIGRLVYISYDTYAPVVRKGDRVVIDSLSYLFRAPRRGEVVFYHPTRGFKVLYSPPGKNGQLPEQREPIEYLIRARNVVERIVGLPGEAVEQKNGVLYVNGEPLEKRYYPLVTDQILEAFGDFRLQVPEDHYCIIMSAVPPEQALIYKVLTPPPILEQGPELKRELQPSDLSTSDTP
jgi:signal peptidase I